MFEKFGKAKSTFEKARQVASVAVSQLLENPKQVEMRKRQAYLLIARKAALEHPTYSTLTLNQDYKKWQTGELQPNSWSNRTHLFPEIAAGQPVNHYMPDAWKEEAVDPAISDTELHEKCVAFCRATSQAFVANATEIANKFAGGEPTDELTMKQAIARLIGTNPNYMTETIFKDPTWRTSQYKPDYTELGVSVNELDVSEDEIMAGVGLSIGLWVRLADLNAQRPVSDIPFAPVFNHCSFTSLIYDSGWVGHNGLEEQYKTSLFDDESQDQFLAPFRSPQFFEAVAESLQAS